MKRLIYISGKMGEKKWQHFGHRLRQLVKDMIGYDPAAIAHEECVSSDTENP